MLHENVRILLYKSEILLLINRPKALVVECRASRPLLKIEVSFRETTKYYITYALY